MSTDLRVTNLSPSTPLSLSTSTPTAAMPISEELDYSTSPKSYRTDALFGESVKFKVALDSLLAKQKLKRSFMYESAQESFTNAPLEELQNYLAQNFLAEGETLEMPKMFQYMEEYRIANGPGSKHDTSEMPAAKMAEKLCEIVSLPKEAILDIMFRSSQLMKNQKEIQGQMTQSMDSIGQIHSERQQQIKIAGLSRRTEEVEAMVSKLEETENQISSIQVQVDALARSIGELGELIRTRKSNKVERKAKREAKIREKNPLDDKLNNLKVEKAGLEHCLIPAKRELQLDTANMQRSQLKDVERISKANTKIAQLGLENAACTKELKEICTLLSRHLVVHDLDEQVRKVQARYDELAEEFGLR